MTDKPDIVGTWRLVAAVARDAAGGALPTPFGPRGMGRVVFTTEGRMMAVLCDGRPSLPAGMAATIPPIAATTRSTGAGS
jgi:hypothetical protein